MIFEILLRSVKCAVVTRIRKNFEQLFIPSRSSTAESRRNERAQAPNRLTILQAVLRRFWFKGKDFLSHSDS